MNGLARELYLKDLQRDANRIARHFHLKPRPRIVAASDRAGLFGWCQADGTIGIRLVNRHTGKPLKYSALIDTLCHELAHLEHWKHDTSFYGYYRRVLGWARSEQIYSPGKANA